eukprot:TRINITY_DN5574_c1_g1_i1.p1 TRINITY_DN5574_c1_g1~~TRINITY_DN5574_c1_g1_i1.p1  ORF type:complete len:491 (-),score=56.24 TRINITY_DN5574_c1_g1_i1:5035-6507(-)
MSFFRCQNGARWQKNFEEKVWYELGSSIMYNVLSRVSKEDFKNIRLCCHEWRRLVDTNVRSLTPTRLEIPKIKALFPSLTVLDLSRAEVDPMALSGIHALNQLQELHLASVTNLTDERMASVAPLTQLSKLSIKKCLDFRGVVFKDMVHLRWSLQSLRLQRVGVQDPGLWAIVNTFVQLKQLSIAFNIQVTGYGLQQVSRLQNLNELCLYACPNLDLEVVRGFTTLTNLKALNVAWCRGVSNEALEEIVKLTGLTELCMKSCPTASAENYRLQIQDDRVSALSQLQKLQKLDLGGNTQLTDDCFTFLATLTDLQLLDVSHTKFNIKGALSAARLPQLKMLHVSHCKNFSSRALDFMVTGSPVPFNIVIDHCGAVSMASVIRYKVCRRLKQLDAHHQMAEIPEPADPPERTWSEYNQSLKRYFSELNSFIKLYPGQAFVGLLLALGVTLCATAWVVVSPLFMMVMIIGLLLFLPMRLALRCCRQQPAENEQ